MFCFERVGFEGLGILCMLSVSSLSISVSVSSHSEFELLKSWTLSKTKIVWIKWLSIHRIPPYVYYIIIKNYLWNFLFPFAVYFFSSCQQVLRFSTPVNFISIPSIQPGRPFWRFLIKTVYLLQFLMYSKRSHEQYQKYRLILLQMFYYVFLVCLFFLIYFYPMISYTLTFYFNLVAQSEEHCVGIRAFLQKTIHSSITRCELSFKFNLTNHIL